jgi:hypothetical protein
VLKITIELWPFGDDTKRKVIAEAEIWNDGNHPRRPLYGNYKGVFHATGRKTIYLAIPDHERGLGAWTLLARFLDLIEKTRQAY